MINQKIINISKLPFEAFALFGNNKNSAINADGFRIIGENLRRSLTHSVVRDSIRHILELSLFVNLPANERVTNSQIILSRFQEAGLISTRQELYNSAYETVVKFTALGSKLYDFFLNITSGSGPSLDVQKIRPIYMTLESIAKPDTENKYSLLQEIDNGLFDIIEGMESFVEEFQSFTKSYTDVVKDDKSASEWFHKVLNSKFMEQYILLSNTEDFDITSKFKRTAKLARQLSADESLINEIALDCKEYYKKIQKQDELPLSECRDLVRNLLESIEFSSRAEYGRSKARISAAIQILVQRMSQYINSFTSGAKDSTVTDTLMTLIWYMEDSNEIPSSLMHLYGAKITDETSLSDRIVRNPQYHLEWLHAKPKDTGEVVIETPDKDKINKLIMGHLKDKTSVNLTDLQMSDKELIETVFYGDIEDCPERKKGIDYVLDYNRNNSIIFNEDIIIRKAKTHE